MVIQYKNAQDLLTKVSYLDVVELTVRLCTCMLLYETLLVNTPYMSFLEGNDTVKAREKNRRFLFFDAKVRG